MQKSLALAAAAVISLAATSQGAVIVTVTDLGNPVSSNNSTTAPGFQAFLVNLSTTDGALIQAVAFGDDAGSPGGFEGPFLQRIARNDPDDPTDDTLTPTGTQRNEAANFASFDSRFLVPTGRVDVSAPSEDNNSVNPPGAPADNTSSDFGQGSFLRGTFGIQSEVQASSLDLLFVVLPDGSSATFTGSVATSTGTFSVAGAIPPVPEPAAVGLLGVGGLLALRRRRA